MFVDVTLKDIVKSATVDIDNDPIKVNYKKYL